MSIILHIFAKLNLINNIMSEKEEMVWYNKKEDVAILSYSALLGLLEENLRHEDVIKTLLNQVNDLRQVVDSWESLVSMPGMIEVEVGVEFIDDYISVEEMFADTMPYEYMYKG